MRRLLRVLMSLINTFLWEDDRKTILRLTAFEGHIIVQFTPWIPEPLKFMQIQEDEMNIFKFFVGTPLHILATTLTL